MTRCLYILAILASKDYAYYGPKLSSSIAVKEKKTSVPGIKEILLVWSIVYNIFEECDRANLANVNISNIFWNLMENAERRKSVHEGKKRKPSMVEF